MLSDAAYRRWVVKQVKDPIVRTFWETEFENYDKKFLLEAIAPIQNKVGQLLMSPHVRNILGPTEAGTINTVLVDSGFFSEKAVQQVEKNEAGEHTGTTVYTAVEKTSHHRSVADLEIKPEPVPPPAGASMKEVMQHRLKTSAGKALYKLRQQTVEPVFGIIKEALGFRHFRLRGHAKASLEWTLVCLAYNLKRLHRLGATLKMVSNS
jgi:hypothetical protein